MKISKTFILVGSTIFSLWHCDRKSDKTLSNVSESYAVWKITRDSVFYETFIFPIDSLADGLVLSQNDSAIGHERYNITNIDSSFNIDGENIYMNPTIQSSFPNGEKYLTYFVDSLQKLQGHPIEGAVEWPCYIGFIVNENGTIEKMGILRKNVRKYVDASMQIMHSMPKWNPAIHKGKKVASFNRLRIKFNVQ